MVDLQTKAAQLEALYPELNQADPIDQDKTNEVLELRDAFITRLYGCRCFAKICRFINGQKPAATVDEVQQQVVKRKSC